MTGKRRVPSPTEAALRPRQVAGRSRSTRSTPPTATGSLVDPRERPCGSCGASLATYRAGTRYCSSACRSRAYDRRTGRHPGAGPRQAKRAIPWPEWGIEPCPRCRYPSADGGYCPACGWSLPRPGTPGGWALHPAGSLSGPVFTSGRARRTGPRLEAMSPVGGSAGELDRLGAAAIPPQEPGQVGIDRRRQGPTGRASARRRLRSSKGSVGAMTPGTPQARGATAAAGARRRSTAHRFRIVPSPR